MVLKVGDVCFSLFLLFPLLRVCTSYVYAEHVVLTSMCVAINMSVMYTRSAFFFSTENHFHDLYEILLSCSLLSTTFIRGDSKLLPCQHSGSVVLSV